jgi:hypothetical protein
LYLSSVRRARNHHHFNHSRLPIKRHYSSSVPTAMVLASNQLKPQRLLRPLLNSTSNSATNTTNNTDSVSTGLKRGSGHQDDKPTKRLRTIVRIIADGPEPPPLTSPQAVDLDSMADKNEALRADLEQVLSERDRLQVKACDVCAKELKRLRRKQSTIVYMRFRADGS